MPSEHAADYELFYLSCKNVGLDQDAIEARKTHEAKGETNVRNLAKKYTTLLGVFEFLTTKHDFYTASKLVDKATDSRRERVKDGLLEMSYGKDSASHKSIAIKVKDGKVHMAISFSIAIACLVGIIAACVMILHNSKSARLQHAHTN